MVDRGDLEARTSKDASEHLINQLSVDAYNLNIPKTASLKEYRFEVIPRNLIDLS